MAGQIRFTGEFTVAPKPGLRPGGWYVGFRCDHCGEHFPLIEDPTDSGDIQTSGDAVFEAVCPGCGRAHDYRAAELVVFEAAQGGPVSTA